MKLKLTILLLLLVPALTFAQDASKKKAYYFYGEQCPHCKRVDANFQENGIYDKYEITKLEVVSNPFNGKLFLEFGKAFGVPDWGGVPAIVFGDKFIVGDQPIIDSFARDIDASGNANELPDPEKIAKANGIKVDPSDQQQPSSVPQSGVVADERNKKNYFPVIIGALVILGAGALVYVNRKK